MRSALNPNSDRHSTTDELSYAVSVSHAVVLVGSYRNDSERSPEAPNSNASTSDPRIDSANLNGPPGDTRRVGGAHT